MHHVDMYSHRLSIQECFLELKTPSSKPKCFPCVQTVHLVKYGTLRAFLKLDTIWKNYLVSRFAYFDPGTNELFPYNTSRFYSCHPSRQIIVTGIKATFSRKSSFTLNENRCLKSVSSSCELTKSLSRRTYLSCV
jgi:hypothetical protein